MSKNNRNDNFIVNFHDLFKKDKVVKIINNLFSKDKNLNKFTDKNGNTLIHHFIKNNFSIKNIKILLSNPFKDNIDINLKNNFNQTPISLAVYKNNFEVVKLLISTNICYINDIRYNYNSTLLMYCIYLNSESNDRFNIIKLLLESKIINSSLKNKDGDTALTYAINKNNYPLTNFLIKYNRENVNNLDNENNSLFMKLITLKNFSTDIFGLLLINSEPNTLFQKNNKGETIIDLMKFLSKEKFDKIYNLLNKFVNNKKNYYFDKVIESANYNDYLIYNYTEYKLDILLFLKADVNNRSNITNLPSFLSFLLINNFDTIKKVIESNVDFRKDYINHLSFSYCFINKDLTYPLLDLIVKEKANINYKTTENYYKIANHNNVMIDCIFYGGLNSKLLKYLFTLGFDLKLHDDYINNLLFEIYTNYDDFEEDNENKPSSVILNITKLFIDYNSNINFTKVNNGQTYSILSLACEKYNENVITFLVDNKANINFQTTYGKSCLSKVCHRKSVNISFIKYLIENSKADINIFDNLGKNCLYYYLNNNTNKEIIQYLLENKASLNSTYANRNLILSSICNRISFEEDSEELLDIIKFLIDKYYKNFENLNDYTIDTRIINYFEEKKHSLLMEKIYIV